MYLLGFDWIAGSSQDNLLIYVFTANKVKRPNMNNERIIKGKKMLISINNNKNDVIYFVINELSFSKVKLLINLESCFRRFLNNVTLS